MQLNRRRDGVTIGADRDPVSELLSQLILGRYCRYLQRFDPHADSQIRSWDQLPGAMTTSARGIGKTVHSSEQAAFCALMVAARKQAGLTQHELARRLKRPQSFVAKYEGGERRMDVVEFVAIARAVGADPVKLLRDLIRDKTLAKPRRATSK